MSIRYCDSNRENDKGFFTICRKFLCQIFVVHFSIYEWYFKYFCYKIFRHDIFSSRNHDNNMLYIKFIEYCSITSLSIESFCITASNFFGSQLIVYRYTYILFLRKHLFIDVIPSLRYLHVLCIFVFKWSRALSFYKHFLLNFLLTNVLRYFFFFWQYLIN